MKMWENPELGKVVKHGNVTSFKRQVIETDHNNKIQILRRRRFEIVRLFIRASDFTSTDAIGVKLCTISSIIIIRRVRVNPTPNAPTNPELAKTNPSCMH